MSDIDIELINSAPADPAGFVAAAENAYYSRVSETVEKVNADRKVKVILLAGPSSSGKTTTANILKDAFIASGRDSDVISLDNFYRSHDDPEYPRLENGGLDMECVGALDIAAIKKCIGDIITGGSVSVPVYDFTTGSRKPVPEEIYVEDDCVVIIEGLHALNPEITMGLDESSLLRIFVSVSTNINENGKRIMSGKKIRFARRLTRDRIYRGYEAERTLSVWQSVLDGEDKYLYPFRDSADLFIDTFHAYEPAVLKKYVLDSFGGQNSSSGDGFIGQIIGFFEKIGGLSEEYVPENSLIREFIPGGIYEALY